MVTHAGNLMPFWVRLRPAALAEVSFVIQRIRARLSIIAQHATLGGDIWYTIYSIGAWKLR